jgi:hypothetical protein
MISSLQRSSVSRKRSFKHRQMGQIETGRSPRGRLMSHMRTKLPLDSMRKLSDVGRRVSPSEKVQHLIRPTREHRISHVQQSLPWLGVGVLDKREVFPRLPARDNEV